MQPRRALCVGLMLCAVAGSASAHANGLEFIAPAVGIGVGLICGAAALLVAQARRKFFKLGAAIALLALVAGLLFIEPEVPSIVEMLALVFLAFLFVYWPFLLGFAAAQGFASRSGQSTWRRLRDFRRTSR